MPLNFKKHIALYIIGILCFLFMGTGFSSAQDVPVYFKLDSPKIVKNNSQFSISLVSRIFDEQADKVTVNLFVDDGIFVKEAVLKQNDESKKIRVTKNLEIKHQNVYSLNISTNENFDKSHPYQIVYTLKSNNQPSTKIGFSVSTYADKQLLHKYSSRDEIKYRYDLSILDIDFFDESKIEEKQTLKFDINSQLCIAPVEDIDNNLVVDFWVKFSGVENEFFSFMDDLSSEKIVSLSRNSFGMLAVDFNGNIETHRESFLSNSVWNHITLNYNYFENSFDFFVNDSLTYSVVPYSFIDLAKISYFFENKDADFPFELYGFRIWDFNDEIIELQKNRFKARPNLENSVVKKEVSAANIRNQYSEQGKQDLIYSNIKIEKNRSLPIFSQAPECNVAIQSSYYSIRWKVNDFESADYFEIEKSDDGTHFYKVGEAASSFDKNEYEFLESKQASENVVYFRVKQVNTDKTEVYSASIKVGVSEIEEFVLEQNYPNPFNPTTRISVEIIVSNDFDINIYDVTGEKVARLHKGFLAQGVYEFTFNGADLPSGIYFCEIKSALTSDVKKMILAK